MIMDKIYAIVPKGTNTYNAVNKYWDEMKSCEKVWLEWSKKYGAENIYSGNILSGVVFRENADAVPDGWINKDFRNRKMPYGVYRPKKAVAPEAYKEMCELPRSMSRTDLCFAIHGTLTMYADGFHEIGDTLIMVIANKDMIPGDVKVIKTSEYYAMKEALEG